MRTLLLPITGSDGLETLLAAGLQLARTYAAHLGVLFVRPDPRAAIPFMGEGLTADAIQDLVDASERQGRARADKARAIFDHVREEAGISLGDGLSGETGPTLSWEETTGFIADRIGRAARLADLTLVAQPGEAASDDAGDILHEVLFRSGRPLLLVPPRLPERIVGTVAVAWNGRAECARTAAAAIPVLQRAESVILLRIDAEHPDRPKIEDFAAYLSRHGIRPEIARRESDAKSAGGAILDAARDLGADLLVMGAFSHSRWREMVVGGVTRHAIEHTTLPVFMSH